MSSPNSDSDDDDDDDLPVIAIDDLRAVMGPDQVRNHNVVVPGLRVGGGTADDLLFDLDEEDPLLLQVLMKQNQQQQPDESSKSASNGDAEGVASEVDRDGESDTAVAVNETAEESAADKTSAGVDTDNSTRANNGASVPLAESNEGDFLEKAAQATVEKAAIAEHAKRDTNEQAHARGEESTLGTQVSQQAFNSGGQDMRVRVAAASEQQSDYLNLFNQPAPPQNPSNDSSTSENTKQQNDSVNPFSRTVRQQRPANNGSTSENNKQTSPHGKIPDAYATQEAGENGKLIGAARTHQQQAGVSQREQAKSPKLPQQRPSQNGRPVPMGLPHAAIPQPHRHLGILSHSVNQVPVSAKQQSEAGSPDQRARSQQQQPLEAPGSFVPVPSAGATAEKSLAQSPDDEDDTNSDMDMSDTNSVLELAALNPQERLGFSEDAALVSSPATTCTTTTVADQCKEQDYLASLDLQIAQQEEQEYLEELSYHIAVAEEAEYLASIKAAIAAAEERERRQADSAASESKKAAKKKKMATAASASNQATTRKTAKKPAGSAASKTKKAAKKKKVTTAASAASKATARKTAKKSGGCKMKAVASSKQLRKKSASVCASPGGKKVDVSKITPSPDGSMATRTVESLKIPRLLPGDDKEFLTATDVREFAEKLQKQRSTKSTGLPLEVDVLRVPKDPGSWKVVAKGSKHTVKVFLSELEAKAVRNKAHKCNIENLVKTGVEIEVRMFSDEKLGATILCLPENNVAGCCIIVRSSSPEGQFARVLGPEACAFGAALLSVDGKECPSIEAFRTLTQRKSSYALALSVSPQADLSKLDKDFLLRGPIMRSASPTNTTTSNILHQDGEKDQSCSTSAGLSGKATFVATSGPTTTESPMPPSSAIPSGKAEASVRNASGGSSSKFRSTASLAAVNPSPENTVNAPQGFKKVRKSASTKTKAAASKVRKTAPSNGANGVAKKKASTWEKTAVVGTLTGTKEGQEASTRTRTQSQLLSKQAASRQKDTSRIPRKGSFVGNGVHTGDHKSLTSKKRPLVSLIVGSASMVSKKARLSAADGQPKEYSVAFDSKLPLGLYCTTSEGFCKILSVNPSGQATKDTRIQPGSTILAVVEDGSRSTITADSHLKQIFESASERGRFVEIVFINAFECPPGRSLTETATEWTSTGVWKGKERQGWDGSLSMIDTAAATQPNERNESNTQQSCTVAKNLRTIEQLTRPRSKVSFSKKATVRWYSTDHPAEGSLKETNPLGKICSTLLPKKRRYNSLENAIRDGTIEDVLEQLCDGEHTEESLQKLRSLTHANGVNATDDKRLSSKDKLLKIYINAFHNVRSARMLKQWERFEIRFAEIEGLGQIDSSYVPQDWCVFGKVYCVEGNSKQELQDIPLHPLASTVTFHADVHSYFMNYNPSICKGRELEVHMQLEKKGEAEKRESLGTVSIKLIDLHNKCSHDHLSRGFVFTVSLTNRRVLPGAALKVQVSRLAAKPEYIEKKRLELLSKFRGLVDWINLFNKDHPSHKQDGSPKLTADMRASDRISLLHAAVMLHDRNMVEKLLKSGADPSAKSGIGSVLSLAHDMADGFASKNDTAKRERMEAIIGLLGEHSSRQKSVTQPNDSKISSPKGTSLESASRKASISQPEQRKLELASTVQPNWLTCGVGRHCLCRYWESDHRCKNPDCLFVHVQRLWGARFQELFEHFKSRTIPLLDESKVHYKKAGDVAGTQWFTAGYSSVNRKSKKGQLVVYAEGGPTALVDGVHGLSWFPTKDAARVQLHNAVLVSKFSRECGIIPSKKCRRVFPKKSHGPYGPADAGASSHRGGVQRRNSQSPESKSAPSCYSPSTGAKSLVSKSAPSYYGPSAGAESPVSKQAPSYYGPSTRAQKDENRDGRGSPSDALMTQPDVGYYGPQNTGRAIRRGSNESEQSSRKRSSPTQQERDIPPLADVRKVRMQDVDGAWIKVLRRKRCKFHPLCSKGRQCDFRHLNDPKQNYLDHGDLPSVSRLADEQNTLTYLRQTDHFGRPFVTARYRSPDDNAFYFAQSNCHGFWDPRNGLWWYEDKHHARNAVLRALDSQAFELGKNKKQRLEE